jgi:hypothetical protein
LCDKQIIKLSVVLPWIERKMKDSYTLRELQLDNLPAGSSAVHRFQSGSVQAGDSVCNPVCDNVEFRLKETYCCTRFVIGLIITVCGM